MLACAQGRAWPEATPWEVTQARGATHEIDFVATEASWTSLDPSPDGRWIVLDLLGHLYRMPASGGAASCLTQDSGIAVNFHPKYSPDGRAIAFVSERGGYHNLWLMRPDGTQPRLLVAEKDIVVASPVWSPDGRAIVAQRQSTRTAGNYLQAALGLWRYSADGGAPAPLTDEATAPGASSASFSPDGRFLYYQFFAGADADTIDLTRGDYRIARMDLASRAVQVLTSGLAPVVSPDGRWLAFARRTAGEVMNRGGILYGPRNGLWLRDLRSGAERLLMQDIDPDIADGGNINGVVPALLPRYAWEPQSRHILIAQGGGIRRVAADAGTVQSLGFSARVHRVISQRVQVARRISDSPASVKSFRWASASPDGRRLVFQALGRHWIRKVSERSAHRLTTGMPLVTEFMPTWSADGRWLAFVTRERPQSGHLWKVSSISGELSQLTTLPSGYLNPLWSADGSAVFAVDVCRIVERCGAGARAGDYELWRIPAAGGERIHVATLAESSFAPPVPVHGPEGRLFFTEHLRRKFEPQTRLVSVRPDGSERRVHMTLPYSEVVAPSPEGRWVAIEKRSDVFVAPFGSGASAQSLSRDDLYGRTPMRVERLSAQGARDPRWLNESQLQLTGAQTYVVRDMASGRTRQRRLHLEMQRPDDGTSVALRDARIITLDRGSVIENGTIVVRGRRIACVGQCDLRGVSRAIDAQGATIIPGLVDMHSAIRPPADVLTPPRSEELEEELSYGITTTFAPSDASSYIYPLAELVEAGVLRGPRLFSAADYFRNDDNARTDYVEVRNLEDARHEAGKNQHAGAVALKNLQLASASERQQLAEAARSAGLAITGHLETGFFEYGLSLAMEGYTGAQHVPTMVPLYADAARFFGQARFIFNATLGIEGAVANSGYFADEGERLRVVRATTDYPFPFQTKFAADVTREGGLATMASHGPGFAAHQEIWMLSRGLGPLRALEASSLNGARFLGLERDIGSIAPGRIADLVLLDADPLDDIHNTRAIRSVMKDGVLHGRDAAAP